MIKITDHQTRSGSKNFCFQMKTPTFITSTYSKTPETEFLRSYPIPDVTKAVVCITGLK